VVRGRRRGKRRGREGSSKEDPSGKEKERKRGTIAQLDRAFGF
jgi:hypothetical protein